MAPEIFLKCECQKYLPRFKSMSDGWLIVHLAAGHHKPVDVWAMGVITYFLLCGYTPFDRDSQAKETEAIIAGDYKFEPAEYWENVSQTAREFIQCCLTINPAKRPTAQEILDHKWLSSEHYVTDHTGAAADLLPQVKKNFDAKKTCTSFYFWLTTGYPSPTFLNIVRKAVFTMMAMKRMTTLASLSPGAEDFNRNLQQYKEESEKVRLLVA
jgi:calcium/calmodulin-dependent protein kinase I